MIVKLKRYTVETTCNIKGDVIKRRYGYVIVFKRHWWNTPRYVCLLQDWYHALCEENEKCKIELKKYIRDATKFNDKKMDIYNKNTAVTIIAIIKEQPDRFILS